MVEDIGEKSFADKKVRQKVIKCNYTDLDA